MLKKKVGLFLILFAFLILGLCPVGIHPSSYLFAYNTKWCPNPSWNNGLNTVITFNRFFDLEAVYLQNHTFYAKYNNTIYGLNVTSGSNVEITLCNWFDEFGLYFIVDKACVIDVFVNDKGEPSKINGELTSFYHAGNKTVNLNIAKESYVGLHWGSGSTVQLDKSKVDVYWTHSVGARKTVYGFGIMKGGYWLYPFNSRTYAQNGRSDIEQIILTIGQNITLTYNEHNHELQENDPYEYIDIAKEWFPEVSSFAWVHYDSTTQYLDVGFNVYFLQQSANESIPAYWNIKYEPKYINQNCNISVKTTSEGTVTNSLNSIFYVSQSILAFAQPVFVAWNLSYLLIGLGGVFLMIFSPVWALRKLQQGEYATGLGFGIVFFLIAVGLFIVWLWR